MTNTPPEDTDTASVPPHDLQAEQSVLGGMLLSKDAITQVVEIIGSADFYRPAHQIIYDALVDLFARDQPVDAISVNAELTKRGQTAVTGGAPYLHTLTGAIPTAANAGYYAKIVSDRAVLRRLVQVGTRITQIGYTGDGEIDDLVRVAQHEATTLNQRQETPGSPGWAPPTPLGQTSSLPTFPTHCLPDWVAAFVDAVAEETQTPLDAPACVALSALSTAAGGRAIVQVRGTYTEPVNLFTVVAMPPASRKSAVFRALTSPILAAEAELAERIRPQIVEAEMARSVAAGVAEKAKTKAVGTKGSPDALADASDAVAAVEDIQIPVQPQLVADDVTPERAASILCDQGGRLSVMSAEGGIFQILAGRYSGAPNFDLFLKGHAGDMLRVDRRDRTEHVESAVLTLGLAVQPEVISEIATGPGFRGKGLLGRFLYALPESTVGTRNVDPDPVPEQVAQRYTERLTRMVTHLFDWTDPIRLQLSPEADQARLDYARELEPRLHPKHGDLGHMSDWAGKSVGAIVRIAALLHLADNPLDGYRLPISGQTMAAAIEIMRYFTAHASAAFDHMGTDPEAERARLVLDWLQRKTPARFTVREAFRELPRGTFRKVADVLPVLETLEGYGWIAAEPPPPRASKGGRPPSPSYQVHPQISGPGA